jgi:molecular chaperone GrpE
VSDSPSRRRAGSEAGDSSDDQDDRHEIDADLSSDDLELGDLELEDDGPEDDIEPIEESEAEPVSSDQLATYREQAELAEERLAQALSAYQELKDENREFRRRMVRNVERRFVQETEQLLLKFIEILDNLDRALASAEQSAVAEPLIDGLIMVRTQLLQALQDEGLERVPVLGLPYDPAVAEAVGTRPVDGADQHHVVLEELLRAYRIGKRVVRAGKVVVGQHESEEPGDDDDA